MGFMRASFVSCAVAVIVLGSAVTASADLKAKKRIVGDVGGGVEMIEYVKGKRTRTEINSGGFAMVTLQQCDIGRVVQMSETTKKYFVMQAVDVASSGTVPPAAGASKGGGVVNITTTITDTGERKQIQGMAARHIKTTVVQEPGPGACDQSKVNMEIDGWYVDLDGYSDGCGATGMASGFGGAASGCHDEIRTKVVGTAKLGYPVMLTINLKDGSSPATAFELVEASQATLDASLFEIPSGYQQVNSFAELLTP